MVQFQMLSGASINYTIFQQTGTSTLLVQYDLCDRRLLQDDELSILPLWLWETTHISRWEELKMGIPVDKTYEWRDLNQRLDSNNMNIILEEDDEEDDSYVEEELSTREY